MEHHGHNEASHLATSGNRSLKIVLAIVLSVMVVEVVGGILSGSLALIGDAGHMLVDALALGLALFALNMARRPATSTRTYGYHRVEIMAALANGTILVLVSLFIFYEAYQRFLEPPRIQAPLMILVASIGLIANLAGLMLLRKASRENLNIKAAFWHVAGDTISSVGVIAAGIIIAVSDGVAEDSLAAFDLQVINTNDAPVASADAYSTDEDVPLSENAPGVLGNDSDPDVGDTLSAVLDTGVTNGSLTLNADGFARTSCNHATIRYFVIDS